jgi:hypothetical protein
VAVQSVKLASSDSANFLRCYSTKITILKVYLNSKVVLSTIFIATLTQPIIIIVKSISKWCYIDSIDYHTMNYFDFNFKIDLKCCSRQLLLGWLKKLIVATELFDLGSVVTVGLHLVEFKFDHFLVERRLILVRRLFGSWFLYKL